MNDYWKDNNLVKPQEVIVCAANRYDDLIICGARHHDPIMNKVLDALKADDVEMAKRGEQGFINQFGEFRTRSEAFLIVKGNGQPFDSERNGGGGDILFSEGIY